MNGDTDSLESEYTETRSTDLRDLDDLSNYDTADELDQIQQDGTEEYQQTWYEQSYEAMQTGSLNIGIEDSELLKNGIHLSEQVLKKYSSPWSKSGRYKYEPELEQSELNKLCKRQPRKFKKCRLQIEGAHSAVAYNTNTCDYVEKIEIPGRSKCGKAFTDDIVVVELLTEDAKSKHKSKNGSNGTTKSSVDGKVRGILKRTRHAGVSHPVYVCEIDDNQNYLVKPFCKTIPKIKVLQQQHFQNNSHIDVYDYDRDNQSLALKETIELDTSMKEAYTFLVATINWEDQYPLGVILKVHKANNNIQANYKSLCLQHQIPTLYRESTMQEVASIMTKMPVEPLPVYSDGRIDMTDTLKAFTIDPPGSRDLDDAISVQEISINLYEVGVHIADVTAIVQKGDKIDKEAYERATTFYPGDNRCPHHMLPEPISSNLCSLLPGKKRLALSVFFKMDKKGELKGDPKFTKTVITSSRGYTYREAQEIIHGKEDENSKEINLLANMSKERRQKRLGDRQFAFPVESHISGNTEDVLETQDAHFLVEELMILCNQSASLLLNRSRNKSSMLLLCQTSPSKDQIETWRKKFPEIADFIMHIQQTGPTLRISARSKLQNLSDQSTVPLQKWVYNDMEKNARTNEVGKYSRLVGTDGLHPEQALALNEWITFQQCAEYRCLRYVEDPKKNGRHFTLDMYPYTHFTSPLRRFADMIVHRLVHAVLEGRNTPYEPEEVHRICDHLNAVKKRERQFAKQCQLLSLGLKLKRKPAMVHGFVQHVSEKEVTIHIPTLDTIPTRCRTIPVSLLNISSQPKMTTDTDSSRDKLTLHWERRIYSAHGGAVHRQHGESYSDYKLINPHQRTVFLPQTEWGNLVKGMLNNGSKHILRNFDRGHLRDTRTQTNEVDDVNSEGGHGNNFRQRCRYSMSFSQSQVVAVQVTARPLRGIYVPAIQLLDMTSNVKQCLEHMQNPIATFARNSSTPTKSYYQNERDYMETWLPVIEMEACARAVQSETATINDLPVMFSRDGSGGEFSLRNSYLQQRDIMYLESILLGRNTGEMPEQNAPLEFVTSADYLCIRCEVTSAGNPTKLSMDSSPSSRKIWIAHARIKAVKRSKKTDDVAIQFQLTNDSPRPFPKMMKRNAQCNVELIEKNKDDR